MTGKLRILVAPMTAGGDFHPTVAAAMGLDARGHDVLIYSERAGIKVLRDLDVATRASPADLDFSRRFVPGGSATLTQILAEHSEQQAIEIAAGVAADFRPDVFVTSLVGAGIARSVGQRLDLPICVINSDFYIGPDPPRPLSEDFDDRVIPEIIYLADAMGAANLVLHAVDTTFDYGFQDLPPDNFYVGPMMWERPSPHPRYLEVPGDPWSLVSISSQKQDDIAIARFAIDAFDGLPLRMVETIGRGHRRKELGDIPDDVHIEHYVPHSVVLKQARLCVSHCGIGTINKALWYGVPIVMVPWGRDQKGVAKRVAHLGAGLIVRPEDLNESALEAGIHALLDDPSYFEAATATSRRFQSQDPVNTSCEYVNRYFS